MTSKRPKWAHSRRGQVGPKVAGLDEVLQRNAPSLSGLARVIKNEHRSMRGDAKTFRHKVEQEIRKPSSSPSPGRQLAQATPFSVGQRPSPIPACACHEERVTSSHAARSPTTIAVVLSAQLGDELPGCPLQDGVAASAATSAAAHEPATELAGGGDDQARQGIIRERRDKFLQLGRGQARGDHVDAVADRLMLAVP